MAIQVEEFSIEDSKIQCHHHTTSSKSEEISNHSFCGLDQTNNILQHGFKTY